MARRRGRRGAGPKGIVATLVLAALAIAGLGVRCAADKLEELALGPEKTAGRPASTSGAERGGGRAPPRAPEAPRAESPHLELGVPVDATPADDHRMVKPQYALSYNPTKNVANWVSWNLDADHFGDEPRHRGKFLVDESLPSGFYRVRHEDYTGSGFDRGHMVRSEERTRSKEANQSTFLMTNILPQEHDLNAGPWLRLEEYAEELAKRQDKELYVAAGGVFGRRPKAIGKGVAVPDSFFKIVVVLERGEGASSVHPGTRVIAVLMPNAEGIKGEGWGRYRTSVAEIEKLTGYEFFSRVPEATRRVLKAKVDEGPEGARRR